MLMILIMVNLIQFSVPSYGEVDETDVETYGEVLRNIGLIEGSNGLLLEDKTLTREEMVTILNRISRTKAEDLTFRVPDQPSFVDVKPTHWAYKEIELAYAKGITSGIGNQYFGLSDTVNMNQVALFLMRSLGYDTTEIEYQSAATYFTEMFSLKLDCSVDGMEPALRGEVFELLAKALILPVENNDVMLLVELEYDENAIVSFLLELDSLINRHGEDQSVELDDQRKYVTSNYRFEKRFISKIDRNRLESEELIEVFEQDKKQTDRIDVLIDTYLSEGNQYVQLSKRDLYSRLDGRSSIDLNVESENYSIQTSTVSSKVIQSESSYEVDTKSSTMQITDDEYRITVGSMYGIGVAVGSVVEYREYKEWGGLIPIVIILSETFYDWKTDSIIELPMYYAVFADANTGEIVEGILACNYGVTYQSVE